MENRNNTWSSWQKMVFGIIQGAILMWIPASIWWAATISNEVKQLQRDVIELKQLVKIKPEYNREILKGLEKRVEKLEDYIHRPE